MQAHDKFDLQRINVLVVDDNAQAMDIIAQVLNGFGARNLTRCESVKAAREALGGSTRFDLILSDASMPVEDGYDLLRWLRREGKEPNRYAPALIVTAHTRASQVKKARDCGAHFVVAKPIQPNVLLERIFWVARDDRLFVECEAYMGPDRRFKFEGPPPGQEGRRASDLTGELGQATEENMSQDELDAMMKVGKVAL